MKLCGEIGSTRCSPYAPLGRGYLKRGVVCGVVLEGLYLLGIVLAAMAAVLVGVVILAHAREVVRPRRMNDGRALATLGRIAPDDVGLEWEDETYRGDGIDMPAWWIAAPGSDVTVVHLHGYASAKVACLAWSPLWHKLGVNLLLPDLRGHGEAGGDYTTAEHLERRDVDALLNELRAKRPAATRRLILCGNSMGAGVALATALLREDLDLVVVDSPVPNFATATREHADLVAAPLPGLTPLAMRLAGWRTGADWDEVAPLTTLPKQRQPVLMFLAADDVYHPGDTADQLVAAASDGATVVRTPGAHMMSYAAEPERYEAALRAAVEAVRGR